MNILTKYRDLDTELTKHTIHHIYPKLCARLYTGTEISQILLVFKKHSFYYCILLMYLSLNVEWMVTVLFLNRYIKQKFLLDKITLRSLLNHPICMSWNTTSSSNNSKYCTAKFFSKNRRLFLSLGPEWYTWLDFEGHIVHAELQFCAVFIDREQLAHCTRWKGN